MEPIDYHGKIFRSVTNDGPEDVDGETRFFYHQKDHYLWGHYAGGQIQAGVLIGVVEKDSSLKFNYCHYDQRGYKKSGVCHSVPVLKSGRLTMHEEWEWTDGVTGKGTSVLEEIK